MQQRNTIFGRHGADTNARALSSLRVCGRNCPDFIRARLSVQLRKYALVKPEIRVNNTSCNVSSYRAVNTLLPHYGSPTI